MNCSDFQKQLYEYMEGGAAEAAEIHVAQCNACQQLVCQERNVARFLSERLRRETETLALRPAVRDNILKSLERKSVHHLAWPLGLAASVLLVAGILLLHHAAKPLTDVVIDASYRIPVHEFRLRGNQIIDTLSYETVDVSETLQESKTPL